METIAKFYLPLGLFILTLGLGIWLSKRGKPYPGLLFNLHKLIALAGVVLAVVKAAQVWNVSTRFSNALPAIILAAVAGLALFISGALLSANKLKYSLMLLLHRVGLGLLVIGLGWLFVLILNL